jgi:membrane fusion protein (multidrug efflux system)
MMVPLLMALLWGCSASEAETASRADAKTPPPARAVRVEVVQLEPADATLELDLPGEVSGQRDANLAAANGGFVERVKVSEGEVVRKGDSLVTVDSAIYGAQLEQADAQLEQAKTDVRRLEALGDLGSEAQLAQARTQLRVAEANRSLAAARMARAVVRAPFSGVVASVGVEEGEVASPGSPVVRLVQLDPAVITLSVSDRDVVSLAVGAPVTVTTAANSQRLEGVVRRVSPAADLRTRAFPVEVEVPNPDGALLPGMIARVVAERPIAESVMVIPQDWLVTQRDKRGVFVTSGDVATWRDVTLGQIIHDRVVVTDGLSEGDRVVITGHRDLVDGDPLIVSREGRCCSAGRPTFGD